jgi:hypothetical protein
MAQEIEHFEESIGQVEELMRRDALQELTNLLSSL